VNTHECVNRLRFLMTASMTERLTFVPHMQEIRSFLGRPNLTALFENGSPPLQLLCMLSWLYDGMSQKWAPQLVICFSVILYSECDKGSI